MLLVNALCKCGKPIAFDGMCYACIRERQTSSGLSETDNSIKKLATRLQDTNNRIKAYSKQYHLRRIYVIDFLGRECIDCGDKAEYYLMCIDHVGSKDFTIETGIMRGYSIKRLIVEARKCVLRCITCHMKRLYETSEYAEAIQLRLIHNESNIMSIRSL